MRLRIVHRLSYQYSRPVFPEPLVIRLRPRCEPAQQLVQHQLQIDPPPAGQSEMLDASGNSVRLAWFSGTRESLALTAVSDVVTLRTNPFNFLLTDDGAATLPVRYPASLAEQLAPCMAMPSEDCDPAVAALADAFADEADGQTQAMLLHAAAELSRRWEKIDRPSGAAWEAGRTVRSKQASCRDLSVLMIAVCRHLGLAARFVSGYHHSREGDNPDDRQLHAWVEAYLPGAGWRGYDPSSGLAVADEHIALAAAPRPEDAAPTSGHFRGDDVVSTLAFHLTITEHDGQMQAAQQQQQ